MKKILIILLVILFRELSFADFCAEDWRFYKLIRFPSKITRAYGTIWVDQETYGGANLSLSDLRILDSSDVEVPYQTTIQSEHTKTTAYSAVLIDLGHTEKATSFVMDLDKSGKIHNTLTITTKSKNFRRSVQIESSDDRLKWKTIREDAIIFDVSTEYHASHLRVAYPNSTMRYLRVSIDRRGLRPLEITGATVIRTEVIPAKEEIRKFQITAENTTDRVSFWELDFGYEKVPVSHLMLRVASINFQRLVKILIPVSVPETGTETQEQTWHSVTKGTIWRFKTKQFVGEKLSVKFSEIRTRRLRIEIHNFDNPPLENVDLILCGVKRELFFPTDRQKPYRLYYGNNEARNPRYDLSAFVQYLDRFKTTRCWLDDQLPNPVFRFKDKRPWTEKHPAIFWGILISTCLILGILFLRKALEISKTEKS